MMEFESKHDFVVDKDNNKQNRLKMIKFLAPFYYSKSDVAEVEFSLVGESEKVSN